MRRSICSGCLLVVLISVPAMAQGGDPDKLVQDGGVLVKGWTGRIDPQAEKQGRKIGDARFVAMGSGLHVTAGPAATYWNPADVASGSYTVRATFTQTRAPAHPEAYGLFIGGTKLDGEDQNYLYCVAFGTGMYSIKHRFGSEVHTLVDRKASDALHKGDAQGKATNEIAWKVDADRVSCVINGVAVETFPRADLIGPGKLESTDGVYGIRVNHNLDVHVAGFGMTKP